MAINFPQNAQTGTTFTNNNTTWQYDGTAWNLISSASTFTVPNSYTAFTVAGQTDVVADSAADTLTFVEGTNITITTDANNDSITINSTGGGGGGSSQNVFSTIAVSGQNDIVADTTTDTLTFVAGTGITIQTNDANDSVTFNATAGSNNFSSLTDTSNANIDISSIYEHAILTLRMSHVANPGRAYQFNSHYAGDNPRLYILSGTTVAFDLSNIGGHPFVLQDNTLTMLTTNLVHVAADGTVSTNTAAQGKDSGMLYWRVPENITNNTNYAYECNLHPEMNGAITIKRLANI